MLVPRSRGVSPQTQRTALLYAELTFREARVMNSAQGLVFAAAALLLCSCHEQSVAAKQLAAVKVDAVTSAGSASGTRYSAHIEPASKVELAFKVGGYVESLASVPGLDGKPRALQEGDSVREGQALTNLRKADYLQRLDEAKAAFQQANSVVEQAERDLERARSLLSSGSINKVDVDNAETRLKSASASADGARARMDEAATAAADTTLRSPMNGVILKRRIEVGALAAPGTVAFVIADISSVKAIFAVPDSVLPRVRLGAVQTLTSDAFPNVTFSGRISRISPSADPRSLVFEAEVLIPNADGRLKSGTVAALSLEAGARAATQAIPLVPLAAIVRGPRPESFAVFVVDDEQGKVTAHLREIELGEYLGRVIPVKKGLTGGERIVVLGAGLLSDGENVELIP
jgi:RND family efflux transporter MFP subunit